MSVLSAAAIRYMMEHCGLVIDPKPRVIQPTSVDLHLGPETVWPEVGNTGNGSYVIDPTLPEKLTVVRRITEEIILHPGSFVLGATVERIELPPGMVAILMGKSTLARIGLQIESAGYVDPGWRGELTLELVNLGPLPIRLIPGMKICQIRFEMVESLNTSPADRVVYGDVEVGSHYQDSTGAVEARFDGSLLPEEIRDRAMLRSLRDPLSAPPDPA